MKIALGIVSNNLTDLTKTINRYGDWFEHIYINYAQEEELKDIETESLTDITKVQVPVNMDFANARNVVMDVLADDIDYIVWLDDDEYFNMSLYKLIQTGTLATILEQDNIDILGVPRENLIDGVPSEVWPDVQFRIMKKDIRWVKKVHEHPDFSDKKTGILPNEFHFIHPKSSERFVEQQELYNKIEDGAGQTDIK